MARICREAGARVRTNVKVRDLDLDAFNHLDGRRLEIIGDGLPPWRGAQWQLTPPGVPHQGAWDRWSVSTQLSGSYLERSLLEDLPMGFSWSPHFVKITSESVLSRSLEPTGSRITNDRASHAIFAAKEPRAPSILFLLCLASARPW